VTPSSGNASTQVFSFLYSDPKGYASISSVSTVINAAFSVVNGCYLMYNPGANNLYLGNDAGTAWLAPVKLGQAGTVQNSQCSVDAASSSSSGSSTNLTVNLALSFLPAFAGIRRIYTEAYDVVDSGWSQAGTWVVGSATPAPISVTPSSGSGTSQIFSFLYLDPKGYASVSSVSTVINAAFSVAHGCYLLYYPGSNSLYLGNDTGTAWLPPVKLGQAGSVQNSQCNVDAGSSSYSGSNMYLTVNLALSFLPAFGGTRNIYTEAYDVVDSGWPQVGTWSVPSVPPAPVSVTPNSGSGSSQTFSFVYSDTKGYTSISSVSSVINASFSVASACYFKYDPVANNLYLSNDTGTAWLAPVKLGQAGSVQNSQCSVDGANSSYSGSGTLLTVNLALGFLPAFGGSRNIYTEVYDGADSGWQQFGTWSVPSVPPAPVSVTPSSGSGSSQTFSFVYSDPKGYTSSSSVSTLINTGFSVSGACYLLYYPGNNNLYLANDTGTAWLAPVKLGQAGSAQNSQCSVDGSKSSSSENGTSLTVNLALTFLPAFGGTRKIYTEVYDVVDSGWPQLGTWTVQ
jgi:hypothetical protein